MKIYEKYEKGEIFIAYYEYSTDCYIIYPFFRREIKNSGLYDITTVYGYSGPVLINNSSAKINEHSILQAFLAEFNYYCTKNYIVSEFVRFHPLIQNQNLVKKNFEINYERETVKMNLEDTNQIWNSIHSKKRNMIRKAEKNGVHINFIISPSVSEINTFYRLYLNTMEKQNASSYYYFDLDFFKNTFNLLKDKAILVNADYEGEIVSSSIIMMKYPYGHYHFSGSNQLGLKVAANDLLLYKVSMYLLEKGYKQFHLGGGYKDNKDSLFKYKKRFSKDGLISFFIGKKIHMPNEYHRLVKENGNNSNSNFFPAYRA